MASRLHRLTLTLHRDAVSSLYRMPRPAVDDAWKVMRSLEEDPTPEASSHVEGHVDTYQIRTDGYRIVYEVFEERAIVRVLRLHLVV